jgi:multisubunit Na+/H+ antiporter MnhB subunit
MKKVTVVYVLSLLLFVIAMYCLQLGTGRGGLIGGVITAVGLGLNAGSFFSKKAN